MLNRWYNNEDVYIFTPSRGQYLSNFINVYEYDIKKIMELLKHTDRRRLIILDDFIEYSTHHREQVNTIFANSRHAKVSIIAILHQFTQLPPASRSNIDFWVFCSSLTNLDLQNIVKELPEEDVNGKNIKKIMAGIICNRIDRFDKIYYDKLNNMIL